jgi:hypothetical protein
MPERFYRASRLTIALQMIWLLDSRQKHAGMTQLPSFFFVIFVAFVVEKYAIESAYSPSL